ncbi:MAG: outer membrane protein assembly factor BamA [Elusimicrobia bacterium GWB2_63_22]|nr:MAG: outer membrane protein assembly factor BamA [Elusimicrobia bacterium GWB2_63_22]
MMKKLQLLLLLTLLPALPLSAQTPDQPQQQAPAAQPASPGIPPAALPGMQDPTAAEPAPLPPPETAAAPAEHADGPWEVAETAVKGSVNIKAKAILKTGKARKKRLYQRSFVGQDIEAILGLGSIDRISVEIDDLPGLPVSPKLAAVGVSSTPVRITYIISEKPMVKTVTVTGAKGMSKGAVKDEMTLKEKDFFDELKVREDLIKITDKYREKGFIDARADYEVKFDTAANLCFLTIALTEGKKARVAAVELEGAAGFKLKKLVKKFKNRPKKIYTPQDLDADYKALEAFYKNNGYADFKITDSTVSFNADRSSVTIHVTLTEGNKQKFGATYFAGNTVYLPSELEPRLEYRRGKLFNQDRFDDTLRGIQDKYADKGYLRAGIQPERVYNEKTGETDVTFTITENNQIFVDHVDVEGNKATKTYVLKREITQKEGEVFSSSKIRRSQEKIFNLGFIDDVSPVINPTADPDKVDLVFDVAEGKPGMLTAGAGISSTDGLVGTLSLSHLNLFGRAYKTSLSWNFGKKVQDYYLSWSTPWIGSHPTSLGLDIFNTRHYKPYRDTVSAYTERRTGGKISLGPRFQDDKYHLTTSYTYEQVRIYEVDDIYAGELQDGTSVTSSVYVEFARDTRDSTYDPTRGCRTSLGLEYAGGALQGDVNYYKPTFSHSYNLKLFSIDEYPFVLSIANRLGFVGRFGSTKSVPVYERYFLGGAETVRGYSNNGQIGPLNGGKVYDVMNIEFKFPLARERRRTIVQWAFFFDIGNSWDGFDDVSGRIGTGTSNLKAGAGFGIRFTTPAFPIRLDWGYGFNHKPGEQRSDIYFTLGNLF